MANYKRTHTKRRIIISGIVAMLAVAYTALCLLLPLKAVVAPQKATTLTITTAASNLPWPKYGEGAVGLGNGSVVQSHGNQIPLPTASVAKLITALAVLKKYPLAPGQQGPTITLDSTDVNFYTTYIAEQGSVVPVSNGEHLTEYQMLEAMLIPSGNNIADSLARWAYGSVSAYDTYANQFVKQLGLNNTHVAGDASGYLPSTTSTSDDLIKLGSKVMANPVLAQIVDKQSANIPNVGVMTNYDNIIGQAGIVGIKTGNSNQAGGVFLGAAKTQVNGKTVTILIALMGAPNLSQVLADTIPMAISVENDFAQTIVVSKGEILGEFSEPWGGMVQVAANNNLMVYLLQGQTAKVHLTLSELKLPTAAGTMIGNISNALNQFSGIQSIPVVTMQSTTLPTWQWKLTHPDEIF